MFLKLLKSTIFLFAPLFLLGQTGATIYAGLTSGFSKDELVTSKNKLHHGYVVGMDARLNSGDLYFLLSGEYVKVDVLSTKSLDHFNNNDKIDIFKGKVGLGFNILHLNDDVFISSKIQGSFDLVMDYDASSIIDELQLNDGFLGAATGLSLNIKSLVIEFEYEKGIINQYYKRPDSTFDFFTLKAGFKF